ncbi:MAG TPA: site-2 protease family protein [Pyrinomonadaceae bacterium]|nr:site-2 protease family protein [Pyrinomonadaceae bacterium]
MRFDNILHRQVRVANVFGIPVRIDYRWFVVFALSAWLIAENFYRGFWYLKPTGEVTSWVVGVATTFLLFLSVFGHELSHALVAKMEGIEIVEIVLHPFGGLARLRREPDSARAEFRIAVAGPASSFIFALVAFAVCSIAFFVFRLELVWAIFAITAGGNLMLAIFNLLPGYPLDGGRVLRAFLWHRGGDLTQATRRVSQFGQLIAGVVIVYGVYMGLRYQAYFMALWSVLVGLFLWDAARAVYRAYGGGGARAVADAMTAPFSVEPDTLVSHLVDAVLPLHRQGAFAVARGRRLHGILTLEDLKRLPRERWHSTRVSEVMRPVAPEFFVEPQASLQDADALMKRNGAGALGVVDDRGELVGFLQRGQIKRRAAAE